MLQQRYKLRLGDGTVLGVDLQGLTTWVLDGKAMVQAADSHQWYPLKEFLAVERAAARRAARLRAREARSETGPSRPLPLVYPKPREDRPLTKVEPPASAEPPADASTPTEIPSLLTEPPEVGGGEEPLSEVAPEITAPEPFQAVPAGTPFVVEATEAGGLEATEPDLPVLAEEDVQAFAEGLPTPLSLEEAAPTVEAAVEESRIEAAAVEGVEPTWIPEEPTLPTASPEATLARPEPDSGPSTLEEDFPPLVQESQGIDAIAPSVPWAPDPDAPRPDPLASLAPEGEPAPAPPSRASLQVLADDPEGQPKPAATEGWRPNAELPLIPLKPLDEEPPATEEARVYDGEDVVETPPLRPPWQDLLLRWLARAASAYDSLLTGWIERLARRPATASPSARAAAPAFSAFASVPWPPMPPSDAAAHAMVGPLDGNPLERLAPPPAIQDLPVLPLADIPEPVEDGGVFGEERRFAQAWRWTWRFALAGALLSGVLYAALRWEAWVPEADRIGLTVFSRIDQIREDRERRERRREALQEATERLPHLSPQTIELLMNEGEGALPDPPEMFRLASEAVDRGAKALTAEELRELRALRRELVSILRPSERERLREYDAARARRLVFPFEGRDVLELVGRGAYALPPESLARLQELNSKAVAAGLPPAVEDERRSAKER